MNYPDFYVPEVWIFDLNSKRSIIVPCVEIYNIYMFKFKLPRNVGGDLLDSGYFHQVFF